MKAMILAAGRGERLRPLTDSCPKPLIMAAGKPLIEYHLNHLAKACFSDVVINHAWLGHMLEDKLGDGCRYGLNIKYSAESPALETGGGIKNALPLLTNGDDDNESFLVVNGDIYIDELPSKSDLVLPKGMLAKLFLVDNPLQHPDGDFSLNKTKVCTSGNNKLTFSGIGVYHSALFDNSPSGTFALPLLLRAAMDNNLVCGQHFKSYWCDVGTIDRLQRLEKYLQC